MTPTESISVNLESGAHHESGHIVIAAVQGLRLKPEGLMIDPSGWGLGCYQDAPDENDESRERNIIAVLAGFAVEKRFREGRCYPATEYMDVTFNRDNVVARTLLGRLAGDYAFNESRLRDRPERLVDEHWLRIGSLASALLDKNWELIRPLKSGGKWSHPDENIAKYVSREEAFRISAERGITAVCDADF